jgi:signal transduction histidine kinase/CheY-like chemotaxis protein
MKNDLLEDFSLMNLHFFTLKFTGQWKSFEKAYLLDHGVKSIRHIRIALLLGFILYFSFGLLDTILAPNEKDVLWFIRYAVVCPVVLGCFFLSFWSGFKFYSQQFIVLILILAGGGISVMVAVTSPPATFSYYAGVILVLMLGYGFSATRFLYASLAGWINLAIYEVVAVWVVQTPTPVLISNNFFFVSANIIGMFSGYAIEFYMRKDFFMARMLDFEREKIADMNRNLEKKVDERTAEIRGMNEALQVEIMARNQAEEKRERLERELYQAQKIESIGNLAGGIAHDFNNILSSILGYTELSLDEVPKGSPLEENLQEVYTAAIRASELVRQILAFARQSHEEVKPIQVNMIIKEVVKFIRASIPVTIDIHQCIESDSLIMGNTTQVHQILMNLCTNSAHAMEEEGGVLTICLKDITMDGKTETSRLELASGDYIEITVSDTGAGIAPEIICSIFDPYFTTKGPGKGTGMGLAMVHGIVESYNGKITVDSKPGEGTTFKIYLPVTRVSKEKTPYESKILPPGKEKILFVDDEAPIIRSGSFLLESLGYKVTGINSSLEALKLFRSNPAEFDMVITDMTMPGMTGDKLAMEMMKIRPDLPVILCTGYSNKISEKEAAGIGIRAFLYKPVVKNDMATIVRKQLDDALA